MDQNQFCETLKDMSFGDILDNSNPFIGEFIQSDKRSLSELIKKLLFEEVNEESPDLLLWLRLLLALEDKSDLVAHLYARFKLPMSSISAYAGILQCRDYFSVSELEGHFCGVVESIRRERRILESQINDARRFFEKISDTSSLQDLRKALEKIDAVEQAVDMAELTSMKKAVQDRMAFIFEGKEAYFADLDDWLDRVCVQMQQQIVKMVDQASRSRSRDSLMKNWCVAPRLAFPMVRFSELTENDRFKVPSFVTDTASFAYIGNKDIEYFWRMQRNFPEEMKRREKRYDRYRSATKAVADFLNDFNCLEDVARYCASLGKYKDIGSIDRLIELAQAFPNGVLPVLRNRVLSSVDSVAYEQAAVEILSRSTDPIAKAKAADLRICGDMIRSGEVAHFGMVPIVAKASYFPGCGSTKGVKERGSCAHDLNVRHILYTQTSDSWRRRQCCGFSEIEGWESSEGYECRTITMKKERIERSYSCGFDLPPDIVRVQEVFKVIEIWVPCRWAVCKIDGSSGMVTLESMGVPPTSRQIPFADPVNGVCPTKIRDTVGEQDVHRIDQDRIESYCTPHGAKRGNRYRYSIDIPLELAPTLWALCGPTTAAQREALENSRVHMYKRMQEELDEKAKQKERAAKKKQEELDEKARQAERAAKQRFEEDRKRRQRKDYETALRLVGLGRKKDERTFGRAGDRERGMIRKNADSALRIFEKLGSYKQSEEFVRRISCAWKANIAIGEVVKLGDEDWVLVKIVRQGEKRIGEFLSVKELFRERFPGVATDRKNNTALKRLNETCLYDLYPFERAMLCFQDNSSSRRNTRWISTARDDVDHFQLPTRSLLSELPDTVLERIDHGAFGWWLASKKDGLFGEKGDYVDKWGVVRRESCLSEVKGIHAIVSITLS